MPVSTFSTYDQIGKQEDVSDVISNIAPTETPFQTMIGTSGSVDNILYQWQEDDLDAPVDNAQVEGFDAPAASMNPTVMRDNTTQIFAKAVKVTGSTKAMKTYGRAQELAYQMAKKGKELKRDFERALVGVSQTKVTGSSGAARKFANYFGMLDAGNVFANGAVNRALTETILLNAMGTIYDVNGEVDTFMIRPSNARTVADFAYRVDAGSVVRNRDLDGGTKKIVNAVDVYVTPWGDTLKVTINRWLKANSALLFAKDSWQIPSYRAWNRKDLPSNGDYEAHLMLGEYGMKHKNFKLSAAITDLT